MYQVLIDGRDLYFPSDAEYAIYDSLLKLQLNDSGTFTCAVPPTNPEYGNIKNRKSMIQVLKNGKEIFCGEVRECEKDFYRTKEICAIGELAFLFDSIQPQAKYQDKTARQLLEIWLAEHNRQTEEKKHFYVGIVTVHDKNDSLYRFTNQETTLDCIRQKLCEKLGGYLRIRKVDGKRYLDLISLQEYGKVCEQPIEFGENLLDYAESTTANELYTCVIPKGARLEKSTIEGLEAYVDIKSVNGGKDYLYSPEAVAAYGWNRCVVSWDDVTLPENLKKKGEQWLKENQFETLTLNLTAADLSLLNVDMESFELGDYIPVSSTPHGMDRTFPVQSLELHLQNPAEDSLQLGNTLKKDYLQENQGQFDAVEEELENNRQTTSFLQSAIDNATNMMTGSKGGYKVSEFDEQGRWLRDLYMNTPSKDTATQVMQINMNGIGFSRDGFDGPYKNAWTIDGVLLGEFLKAGTVTTEKLSVEYKESVSEEINSVATSKLNVAKGLIEAEVTRATEAERTLAADLKNVKQDIEEFQGNIDGAFRDGIITEAEKISIEKYLNELKKDNKSILKQVDAVMDMVKPSQPAGDNLSIKFNSGCKTEISSENKVDYLQLYYKKGEKIYQALGRASGEEVAGKTFIVPATEIYLYWKSNTSITDYGFAVDAINFTSSAATLTGTVQPLPDCAVTEVASPSLLCTTHPYENNEEKLWHYRAKAVTKTDLQTLRKSYVDAYNTLVNTITTAIADKKATEAELQAVNSKFDAYNTVLANLEEALKNAGIDIAAVAAAGVAEYAHANLKVTADSIQAEVERAKKEEQQLKQTLADTEDNLNDFKTEIDTTFKDGVISEAEAEAIEKYLNIIDTDYESITKQCDSILGSMPSGNLTGKTLKLTFSEKCETEIGPEGEKTDYLNIYYVENGELYQYKDRLSGADIAGKTFIFPEAEIYISWNSDYNNINDREYYGFSIDVLEMSNDPPNVEATSSARIPSYFINTKSKSVMSTTHPYEHGGYKTWHYKNPKIIKNNITAKMNAFSNAYKALSMSIIHAISDRKATAEELEDVNEKFAKYNTALSELKEILSIAQMDIALGTAGETAEYASANFKVTADQIKAEVTRATQAEEVLKGSLDIQADRIKAEVERATKEEGKLKSSLELQADMIESKVEIDEIGSYVQQYYNRVLIGFNNDSKYVQITAGQIAIYDYGITDSKKRAVFNEDGNHFYRDGYYVGKIGTNSWKQDSSHKGIVFDLETNGKYMTWASREFPEDDFYTAIWTYGKAGSIYGEKGLHAGANIYLEGHSLIMDEDVNGSYLNGGNGYMNLHVNDHIKFRIGSQDRVKIDYESLHVYNGITAYNNTALDFYADLDMHGYSIYNNSDARLKENIHEPEESALDKLLQLDILQYDWRESKKHVNMGVIAQQVQEVIPEAVKVSDKNGLYSVNQLAFIPYLIKAVQELSGKPLPISTYITHTYTKEEIEKAMESARPPVPELEKEKPEPLVVKIYDTDKEEKHGPEQKQRTSKTGKKAKTRNC